ncbi:unnamed protein product [Rotaria sp. Silwood2]|nr:unnamed protein product [Rotaria sp. Silwood2]CAF4180112.1 unnamed protein product [Rotaria sp. Silwood2]
MEHSRSQLNDLPNEILLIIFKYLHHHHMIYSFININKRFNLIVDHIIEKQLVLTSLNDSSFSINNDIILDRVSRILPSIHHKIQCIGLDASIIEQILFSTTYPNLKTLVLYVTSSTAINLFNGKILSSVPP